MASASAGGGSNGSIEEARSWLVEVRSLNRQYK